MGPTEPFLLRGGCGRVSHNAGSHYSGLNILQMLRQGPEQTIQKAGTSCRGNLPGPTSFICVSHIRVKSSVMSSIPLLLVHSFSPTVLCVLWRQRAWGKGPLQNVGSCSGSWPVFTLVISTVWSLCFPREASGLPPTPCPVSESTHTDTHTHSNVFCT